MSPKSERRRPCLVEMEDFECGFDDPFHQEEEPLEERSLNLLNESKVDQAFAEAKAKKRGGKKHKVKWMRRPMMMPEAILEFLDEDLRENAIRYLSNFLIEVLLACGSLCCFYPSLRARSRQPVKRYKKLIADTFPRSQYHKILRGSGQVVDGDKDIVYMHTNLSLDLPSEEVFDFSRGEMTQQKIKCNSRVQLPLQQETWILWSWFSVWKTKANAIQI